MALFKEEIVLQRLKIKTHLIEPPKRKVDGFSFTEFNSCQSWRIWSHWDKRLTKDCKKKNTTSSNLLSCTLFVAIMVCPPVMIPNCRDAVNVASQWAWVSLSQKTCHCFNRLNFALVVIISASVRVFFVKRKVREQREPARGLPRSCTYK